MQNILTCPALFLPFCPVSSTLLLLEFMIETAVVEKRLHLPAEITAIVNRLSKWQVDTLLISC